MASGTAEVGTLPVRGYHFVDGQHSEPSRHLGDDW